MLLHTRPAPFVAAPVAPTEVIAVPVRRLSPALLPFVPTSAWTSNLYSPAELTGTGQAAAGNAWTLAASTLGLVGTGLGAYHGYKRTGSIGWAIGWALLGGLFPIITIPVAIAQGFAKPDPAFPGARANARTGGRRRPLSAAP